MPDDSPTRTLKIPVALRASSFGAVDQPAARTACLVIIDGPELGRRWVLDDRPLLIGRGDECEAAVDVDYLSRQHCRISSGVGGVHVIEDQGSTNGTVVNSEEITGPRELASGDHIAVGGAVFKYLSGDDMEALYHEEIYRLSIADGLTGVHNTRYLMEFLDHELARYSRYGRPLSQMMIGIDHFKEVQVTFGPDAADQVLREVAAVIKARIRKSDCLARSGSQEFVLVMPEVGTEKACIVAESLRGLVEARAVAWEDKRIPVTISIGVVQVTPDVSDARTFLELAAVNLQEAREGGHNRVAT